MKAAVCARYGPPEVLQIQDVATPVPSDDEVLLRSPGQRAKIALALAQAIEADVAAQARR